MVRIHAGEYGYKPARVTVESGRKTRVIFVTDPDAGCTRALIIGGQEFILPERGRKVFLIPAQEPGTIRYVCGMGMYRGQIKVV